MSVYFTLSIRVYDITNNNNNNNEVKTKLLGVIYNEYNLQSYQTNSI